jgi:hypothetical protein
MTEDKPVAYMRFWAKQILAQGGYYETAEGFEVCEKGDRGDDGSKAFPVYARQEQTNWKEAVLNELIVAHVYTKEHESNPRKAIQDAISWNCAVALDPKVSSDAQELVEQGRQERKPLTEAQLRECARAMDAQPLSEGWPELRKFARAIESAHGIKEGK